MLIDLRGYEFFGSIKKWSTNREEERKTKTTRNRFCTYSQTNTVFNLILSKRVLPEFCSESFFVSNNNYLSVVPRI